MELRQFMQNLNKLINENPLVLTYDVVTAKDDEGNGYELVHFDPQIGTYNKNDKEFYPERESNAICIN